MTFEIKDRYTSRVLYSSDTAKDMREAVIEAVKARANLSGADLSGADLRSAYLRSADLSGANLSGADLSGANLSGANLSGAYLRSADLSGANLSGADLRSAYLSGANLSGADLRSADLRSADLSGANLSGANLSGAKGINPFAVQPLNLLRDQPGKLRLYKVVTDKYMSPMYHSFGGSAINYKIGAKLTVDDANEDDFVTCGAGINVAPLDWCIALVRGEGYHAHRRIMIVEFTANDIAAIPTAGEGKIRLHRCKVVGELDYETYGIAHLAGPTANGIDPDAPDVKPEPIPF